MNASAVSPVITWRSRLKLPTVGRASVLVWLCMFSLVLSPQAATLVSLDSTELECPAEEEGETTERETVVKFSRRSSEKQRSHTLLIRASSPDSIYRPCSYTPPVRVSTGHRLANGLTAPLLI